MEPDLAPFLPDHIDKTPEYCLAQILQTTRLLLAEAAANIRDRRSLRVLDLALLNAIDDLEQIDAPAQIIQSEPGAARERPSDSQQERLQAALCELEQNEDARLEHPGIAQLKWLLSLVTKSPSPERRNSEA
jgi:hypothetical protein